MPAPAPPPMTIGPEPRPEPDPDGEALTLAQALQLAQQLQRHDRLDDAEQVYRQVLAQCPGEPNALHYLGVLRHQQGRQHEALALLQLAIERDPDAVAPWINLANVLIECGLLDDAVKALGNATLLDHRSVLAQNNLGILHLRRRAWDEAERVFKQALAQCPDAAYLHYNLASLYFQTDRLAECVAHSLQSHGLDRNHVQTRMMITRVLLRQGEHARAVANLREWATEAPDNAEARHHLAALGGLPTPSRAPDDYVSQHFDRIADAFDQHLDKLGYDGPRQVAAALAALPRGLPADAVVIDAGCGTGLCMPVLRPLAARLEGVDLSAGMLRHARARGGYDALHCAELTAFLDQRPASCDLVVCLDVLIYFGALPPVLAACHRALRGTGVLMGGVERLADEAGDFALAFTGRYAHAGRYLREQLAATGFRLLSLHAVVIRFEMNEPVQGWFFVAERAP